MQGLDENLDLGAPIICAGFDLEAALLRENAARMAREDSGCILEDEEEIEDALPQSASPRVHQPSTAPIGITAPLTGTAKKNDQKRCRDREKRKAATVASLNSTTPPAPTPRVLDKATQSTPIAITFAAADFRATKPRWTGLAQPLEHPLLPHAADAEFLKKHLQYFDWDGKTTHVILDRKGRIIGVLIAPPLPGEDWDPVLKAATAAMREARNKMAFPAGAYHHRRAYAEGEGFPTCTRGCAFGGGRERVGNIKASSAKNAAAMEELLDNPSVIRMATYPIPHFQTLCYPIFADYHATKQTVLQKNPSLHRTFARSPFAAVTANLGPVSVSPPHADFGNKADGMCLIGALGDFNADQGGHLVCWDYDLIDGEERFSLIQYSAGGLFRWVNNGFQSDRAWRESATAEDIQRREVERNARCAAALKKFSLWKDVKVKNFTGRSRVEVWDSGDVADFSDLTDYESEGERPTKRRPTKCARPTKRARWT
ncbi:hypothetical protein B0H14DRAFT_3513344 [Mycena olivaceomarginata]|nr:hypothetical protein B0H14DRAFT_3513344 [Mycena olivaceomarginata]